MKATIVPLQILWHAIYYFGSYPSQLGRTISSFFSLHAYIALSVTIKAIPLGGGFLARSSWILLCPVSEIHGSFIKKNLLSIPERQSREIVIINIVLIFSSMPWPTIWKGVSYTWSWGFYSLYFFVLLGRDDVIVLVDFKVLWCHKMSLLRHMLCWIKIQDDYRDLFLK